VDHIDRGGADVEPDRYRSRLAFGASASLALSTGSRLAPDSYGRLALDTDDPPATSLRSLACGSRVSHFVGSPP